MPIEEYIKGVVAAEMPASFGVEALRAQAIAARTFTLRRMVAAGGPGCTAHSGADICTDHRHCQAWVSPVYSRKIQDAVNSTKGLVATYQGGLIDACYHAASGGATDNSEEVWSSAVPYLKGVSTEFEAKEPDFLKEVSFAMDELEKQLEVSLKERKSTTYKVAGKDVHVISEERMDKPIEVLEASKAGRVKEIRIGDKVFSGYALRTLLGLPSTKMTYRIADNKVYITTTGYGHGVGMSQYGANAMADSGKNYVEILKHYYQGIEVVDYVNAQVK
jgi:stage II sporulation protein D